MKSNHNIKPVDLTAISEVKLTYQSKVKASDRVKINHSEDAFNVL